MSDYDTCTYCEKYADYGVSFGCGDPDCCPVDYDLVCEDHIPEEDAFTTVWQRGGIVSEDTIRLLDIL